MAHRLLLKTKFQELKQKDGESIQAFSNRLEEVAHELEGAGAPIQEEEQVLKFLGGVSSKFKAVVVALETLDQDMDYVTVVNKLLHAELRMGMPESHEEKGGAALQTRDSKPKSASWRKCPNQTKGSDPHAGKPNYSKDKPDLQCFYCGYKGHYKRECRKLMRDKERGAVKANAVQPKRFDNGGARDDGSNEEHHANAARKRGQAHFVFASNNSP